MTHAHGHDHHTTTSTGVSGGRPFFADEDWQWFQKEDAWAAKMIVGLMSSIFTVGLLIYSTIAFVVGG